MSIGLQGHVPSGQRKWDKAQEVALATLTHTRTGGREVTQSSSRERDRLASHNSGVDFPLCNVKQTNTTVSLNTVSSTATDL